MQVIKTHGETSLVAVPLLKHPAHPALGARLYSPGIFVGGSFFSLFYSPQSQVSKHSKGNEADNNAATCNGFPSTLLPKPSNKWLFKGPLREQSNPTISHSQLSSPLFRQQAKFPSCRETRIHVSFGIEAHVKYVGNSCQVDFQCSPLVSL